MSDRVHVVCTKCARGIADVLPSTGYRGEFMLFGYINTRVDGLMRHVWIARYMCLGCF
jgi:hypothetical protein